MHEDVRIFAGASTGHRMNDLVREAEAERLARSTRRARLADRQGANRRFARAALTAVVWPIKP
jgi:hypothetical protein